MNIILEKIIDSRYNEYLNTIALEGNTEDEDNECEIILNDKKEVLGVIEYSVRDNGIYIKYIHIKDKYRRKGIATKAIKILNKDSDIYGGSAFDAIDFWKSIGAELDIDNIDYYIENWLCIPFSLMMKKL